MTDKIKHGGLAVTVFVVLTGTLLWTTGTFSSGKAASAEPKQVAEHSQGKEAEHGKTADACCPADAKKAPSLAEIETVQCEHKIRQIDCNECRYELGVVKVDPSVTGALVTTAKAEKRDLVDTLRLTGEVQFDQTKVVEIVPMTAGRIVAIKARLGQSVKAGDVLAVIHSSELGEAKAAYMDAYTTFQIAGMEQARQVAVNAALERLLEHLKKNGTRDLSAEATGGLKQPLGEWRSKLIGVASRLQKARVGYEREKGLLEKKVSSKADYEAALQEFQTTQADYDAMVDEVQLGLSLSKLRADNAAKQAEAKRDAAEQRLHLLGLDDDAVRAAAGRKENGSFAQLEIKSPRGGTITAQAGAEGRYVDTTHSLFTVADLSNVWIWCDLYERDLAVLHDRLAKDGSAKAMVRVPSFPETAFEGGVDLIGSAVDESTRTVKVRVQLANAGGKLKPGMFATVEVQLPAGRAGTLVPRSAVLSDEGRSFAFEHWKADLWLKRDVTLGASQGDLVEITGGLAPGATIATGGAFLFKSDVLRAKMGAGCAD